jgi:hypothetical protein
MIMGSSTKSKGSIHDGDASARSGRKMAGAVTSARGAMHGRFDNELGRGGSDRPYGQDEGIRGAPKGEYREGRKA